MNLGDIGSLFSIVGFAITLVTFIKLRNTSKVVKEAKQSVLSLTEKLSKHDLLAELNMVISDMALAKPPASEASTFVYTHLQRSLIRFCGLYSGLSDAQKLILNKCIFDIKDIEGKLINISGDATIAANRTLISHRNALISLECELRQELGGIE